MIFSHLFLHNRIHRTVNLASINIITCFGGDTKANWVHREDYLALCFILKCLEVSQETMSKMKFIHCSAFANLVRVLISFVGLNIEIH